jgi:hypothetical protein
MYHPAHVDGRSLVFIRETRWGYERVESGVLSHDGESLRLTETMSSRERRITAEELSQFMHVTVANRIAACKGFDFFVLVPSDDAPINSKASAV